MIESSRGDRYRGALLGLAAGDAVGTTLEFKSRGAFDPITDMVGGGPFHLEPGQWTDDTSMALCLATSLVHCDGFDARDQMDRYCDWWSRGYLSSTGTCFDIGNTVSDALRRYQRTNDPFAGSADPKSAGNGSLMRLAPVVLFYHPDLDAITRYAGESSRTTHAANEAIDACKIFAQCLAAVLDGRSKAAALAAAAGSDGSERLRSIAAARYLDWPIERIRGTGYVVDCLEAALWCFGHTNDFRSAILRAANLGDDADTTAAVCGQIAGAYYGASGIPRKWLDQVVLRDEIVALADSLMRVAPSAKPQGDPCPN
jgi:ADP-ribosyl-[dinitrogen reductase] hydrolase